MLSLFSYICWGVVIYIYLNNPLFAVLGGMGSIKLLYPFALLGVFLSYRRINLFVNENKNFIFLFVSILLFHFVHYVMGASFDFFHSTIVALIEVVVIPYWICRYGLLANNLSIYRVLYLIAAFASLVSLLCFLNPNINLFVKYQLQIVSDFLSENDFRGFGISDSLTYAYGIIQGTILSLWFVKGRKDKWFVFFIPFVIFSILVNARVGLLIPLAFLLYILFRRRSIKLLITVSFFAVAAIFSMVEILRHGNEQTLLWIDDFLKEFSVFSTGDIRDARTANTLLNDMIIWPETFSQWIWGRGESLFLRAGQNSDVGFILQLNYGGIIYICLLLLLLFLLAQRLFENREYDILILFLLVYCIANLKGDFVLNTGGFRLLVLLIMTIYQSHKEIFCMTPITR